MAFRTLALFQDSASNLIAGYRRLTVPKKAIIWIGFIFISLLLLRHPGQTLAGSPVPPIFYGGKLPPPTADKEAWKARSRTVKEAFQHAYNRYELISFGKDELKPQSNTSADNLNGWGLTIVDSLDTLLLMGLDDEFERAMEFVKTIDFTQKSQRIGFFETIIRYVGGFLSAYHLTSTSHKSHYRDQYPTMLLRKADELAEVLNLAFNTTSGLPSGSVNVKDRVLSLSGFRGSTALAEMASCQMEWKYLAHLTNKKEYFHLSDRVMDLMEQQQGKTFTPAMVPNEDGELVEKLVDDQETGLWTTSWYLEDGTMFGHQISAGAMADSAFEYLLKQYLLSGRTEERLLKMYLKAMDGIINHLLYLSKDRNLLYVTDLGNWATPSGKMEHLSCYLPGVLALGARLLDPEYPWLDRFSSRIIPRSPLPTQPEGLRAKLDLHMRAAAGLAHTCWVMYDEMPNGIGPEIMQFYDNPLPEGALTRHKYRDLRWGPKVEAWERSGRVGPLVGTEGWDMSPLSEAEWRVRDGRYILRPEAIEAMYLLWRTTGDPVWRDRGWKMFEAINNHTRTENAYASVYYIETDNPRQVDNMPSFFLAETLKYAYLVTLDEEPLPLDQIVFNTEAHPLPVFQWTPEQIAEWGIH